MKMKMFFATILLSGLLFSTGCEKAKSLLDVKFDATYTVNMNMNIPASGSIAGVQSAFEGSATIDPTTNEEVAKYLNLIKSWKVTELTGTFKNVTKNAVLHSVTITFTSEAGKAEWTIKNLQIKNDNTFTLDNANGQWDELDKILLASLKNKKFTVTIKGNTDIDDFSFTLSVKIKSTVTANPLGSK